MVEEKGQGISGHIQCACGNGGREANVSLGVQAHPMPDPGFGLCYYEWHGSPTGKQPYYYTARDGSSLTIAGIWDEWKDIETGEPLKSCTMIITNANELASKIHDRMPVLLQPKDFDGWLVGNAGTELLKPAANDYLQAWPVSRRVNSSRAPGDDPTLIDRVAA
jgi:putative SOS response-associated peptidase YedK